MNDSASHNVASLSCVSPSPRASIDASRSTSSLKPPHPNSGMHTVVDLSNKSTKHFKYSWMGWEHAEKIDTQWEREDPEDWAYECDLCTHCL